MGAQGCGRWGGGEKLQKRFRVDVLEFGQGADRTEQQWRWVVDAMPEWSVSSELGRLGQLTTNSSDTWTHRQAIVDRLCSSGTKCIEVWSVIQQASLQTAPKVGVHFMDLTEEPSHARMTEIYEPIWRDVSLDKEPSFSGRGMMQENFTSSARTGQDSDHSGSTKQIGGTTGEAHTRSRAHGHRNVVGVENHKMPQGIPQLENHPHSDLPSVSSDSETTISLSSWSNWESYNMYGPIDEGRSLQPSSPTDVKRDVNNPGQSFLPPDISPQSAPRNVSPLILITGKRHDSPASSKLEISPAPHSIFRHNLQSRESAPAKLQHLQHTSNPYPSLNTNPHSNPSTYPYPDTKNKPYYHLSSSSPKLSESFFSLDNSFPHRLASTRAQIPTGSAPPAAAALPLQAEVSKLSPLSLNELAYSSYISIAPEPHSSPTYQLIKLPTIHTSFPTSVLEPVYPELPGAQASSALKVSEPQFAMIASSGSHTQTTSPEKTVYLAPSILKKKPVRHMPGPLDTSPRDVIAHHSQTPPQLSGEWTHCPVQNLSCVAPVSPTMPHANICAVSSISPSGQEMASQHLHDGTMKNLTESNPMPFHHFVIMENSWLPGHILLTKVTPENMAESVSGPREMGLVDAGGSKHANTVDPKRTNCAPQAESPESNRIEAESAIAFPSINRAVGSAHPYLKKDPASHENSSSTSFATVSLLKEPEVSFSSERGHTGSGMVKPLSQENGGNLLHTDIVSQVAHSPAEFHPEVLKLQNQVSKQDVAASSGSLPTGPSKQDLEQANHCGNRETVRPKAWMDSLFSFVPDLNSVETYINRAMENIADALVLEISSLQDIGAETEPDGLRPIAASEVTTVRSDLTRMVDAAGNQLSLGKLYYQGVMEGTSGGAQPKVNDDHMEYTLYDDPNTVYYLPTVSFNYGTMNRTISQSQYTSRGKSLGDPSLSSRSSASSFSSMGLMDTEAQTDVHNEGTLSRPDGEKNVANSEVSESKSSQGLSHTNVHASKPSGSSEQTLSQDRSVQSSAPQTQQWSSGSHCNVMNKPHCNQTFRISLRKSSKAFHNASPKDSLTKPTTQLSPSTSTASQTIKQKDLKSQLQNAHSEDHISSSLYSKLSSRSFHFLISPKEKEARVPHHQCAYKTNRSESENTLLSGKMSSCFMEDREINFTGKRYNEPAYSTVTPVSSSSQNAPKKSLNFIKSVKSADNVLPDWRQKNKSQILVDHSSLSQGHLAASDGSAGVPGVTISTNLAVRQIHLFGTPLPEVKVVVGKRQLSFAEKSHSPMLYESSNKLIVDSKSESDMVSTVSQISNTSLTPKRKAPVLSEPYRSWKIKLLNAKNSLSNSHHLVWMKDPRLKPVPNRHAPIAPSCPSQDSCSTQKPSQRAPGVSQPVENIHTLPSTISKYILHLEKNHDQDSRAVGQPVSPTPAFQLGPQPSQKFTSILQQASTSNPAMLSAGKKSIRSPDQAHFLTEKSGSPDQSHVRKTITAKGNTSKQMQSSNEKPISQPFYVKVNIFKKTQPSHDKVNMSKETEPSNEKPNTSKQPQTHIERPNSSKPSQTATENPNILKQSKTPFEKPNNSKPSQTPIEKPTNSKQPHAPYEKPNTSRQASPFIEKPSISKQPHPSHGTTFTSEQAPVSTGQACISKLPSLQPSSSPPRKPIDDDKPTKSTPKLKSLFRYKH